MQHHASDKATLTIADICRAIADGLLPAREEDGDYTISERDLRRLIEEGKVAPAYAYAQRSSRVSAGNRDSQHDLCGTR
jgi:hypothetical protein